MRETSRGIDPREASEKAAELRKEYAEKNLSDEKQKEAETMKNKKPADESREQVEAGKIAKQYLEKLKRKSDKAA